jgi:hypothetical protein
LRTFLRDHPLRLTSRIATVEVPRVAARNRPGATGHLSAAFKLVALIEVTPELAAAAAQVSPPSLRTLDAIHVASAKSVGEDLAAFVTYDTRLADAARMAGLRVEAPA